jgi:hypothetical protein
MANPMAGACAASVLFNLPGDRVLDVTRDAAGLQRTVPVATAR